MFTMFFSTISIDSGFEESQRSTKLLKLCNYLLPQPFLSICSIQGITASGRGGSGGNNAEDTVHSVFNIPRCVCVYILVYALTGLDRKADGDRVRGAMSHV